jgi:uncharacterized protein YndB with AHSA1/START domain
VARTETHINASPRAVFRVLSDPRSYAYWVFGSAEIRDADPEWPQVGSRFHHTVGIGPLRIKDHTEVEDVQPDRHMELQAKARPLGSARVKLELQRKRRGTKVTMTEDPADLPSALLFLPLTHLLVRGRNERSLERLAELAEGRRPIPQDGGSGSSQTAVGLSFAVVRGTLGVAAIGPRMALRLIRAPFRS